ncbi:MAG: amidohydrolase family protein [Gammaproteobacteria bacterium]|nr:amidohydrolase family protein [Gammaproteobacteria bacterium]
MFRVTTRLSTTCLFLSLACAAVNTPAQSVLIENVRIFNGVDAKLTAGHVLVEGNLIRKVSTQTIDAPADALVIDGGNRVLTPGFIDLHAHLIPQYPLRHAKYHALVAGAYAADAARFYLHSGFTTIRDAGGTHPDLALAIETGELIGPRIYPSGAILSQTAGHGDFRLRHEAHPLLHPAGGDAYQSHDESVLVDGVAQTLAAARENLRLGATQIKIMGGGGVMSEFDPIHTLQPSPEEIRAAVQAAADWGTYVMAHAYTSEAVRRLVENGVRCIEHGLLIDDATARLVASNDVIISTQLVVFRILQDLPDIEAANLEKLKIVLAGQENLIRLIKKYRISTGFGTDLVFGAYRMLAREFTARAEYWPAAEVLRQATSESARIIRMAGKLNRHGDFGEIREGWVADLLLINGEPLQDLSILENPDRSLALIMKGGQLVKSNL